MESLREAASEFLSHPRIAVAGVARDGASAANIVYRRLRYRSFGTGSVSAEAVALAEREGLAAIAGACPMMFLQPVDLGHRCMRWMLGATGKLPAAGAYEVMQPVTEEP